jgi:hypothetical protein
MTFWMLFLDLHRTPPVPILLSRILSCEIGLVSRAYKSYHQKKENLVHVTWWFIGTKGANPARNTLWPGNVPSRGGERGTLRIDQLIICSGKTKPSVFLVHFLLSAES